MRGYFINGCLVFYQGLQIFESNKKALCLPPRHFHCSLTFVKQSRTKKKHSASGLVIFIPLSFVHSYVRKFAARRGSAALIVSDNVKSFKATSKVLKKLSDDHEVASHFVKNRIEWMFNLEKGPWDETFHNKNIVKSFCSYISLRMIWK